MPTNGTIMAKKPVHKPIDAFRKLKENPTESLAAILQWSKGILVRYIRKYIQNDDELIKDVIAETLQAVWIQHTKISELKDPEIWLLRIAYNISMSKLRKKKKYYTEPIDEHRFLKSDSATEADIERKELDKLLTQAIETLSPKERIVFILSRTEGVNTKEIAYRCRTSEQTVKNQLSSGLKKIHQYFKEVLTAVIFI